jgi:hypothetical protein
VKVIHPPCGLGNQLVECKNCHGNGFIEYRCNCREADCGHGGFAAGKERGLYQKYWIRRTDGSSEANEKHADCEYFVLDWTHDEFVIPAMQAYADACAQTFPELAADIRSRIQHHKSQTPSGGG